MNNQTRSRRRVQLLSQRKSNISLSQSPENQLELNLTQAIQPTEDEIFKSHPLPFEEQKPVADEQKTNPEEWVFEKQGHLLLDRQQCFDLED